MAFEDRRHVARVFDFEVSILNDLLKYFLGEDDIETFFGPIVFIEDGYVWINNKFVLGIPHLPTIEFWYGSINTTWGSGFEYRRSICRTRTGSIWGGVLQNVRSFRHICMYSLWNLFFSQSVIAVVTGQILF